MKMHPVESSGIKAIGHDPATNTMRVQFNGGRTYEYSGVTAEHHKALISADSIGGHFSRHVRDKFEHTRIA